MYSLYEMANGSESTAAFPIDHKVYVLVKMHEGLPSMEIRFFKKEEGSLSLESELGVRMTRIGWDQLVVDSDEMLSLMKDPSYLQDQNEEIREFVIEENVLARPFTGLMIEMFYSKEYSDIYLTAKQFTKLVKGLRENINVAFESLEYE